MRPIRKPQRRTGAVLLIVIQVEFVTSAYLRALMSTHLFMGVLLAGPLAVKLASTGYPFVRYYSGSIPFVRRGPPRLPLRVLAVPLVAITVVLFGSGFGLLFWARNGQYRCSRCTTRAR